MNKPKPKSLLSKLIPQPSPQATVDQLSGQIQALATRLEALREQGAGNSPEFRKIEAMLTVVQDKVLMAESKIKQ